ncbi:helix-turn-helix domain-containing protein [Larkinella soli]|uniref:helix-turn-helix domain-containing protein n=1 Tax=Larkinella soli TaxID=1770527 RepID=UPI000FFBAFA6|nr:helix-turn-helix transcriptional regulator [Larkinella soli]
MQQLAFKVRKLREIFCYSQEYVAYHLGISQAAYSKKETGRTSLSLVCLQKLAELYHFSIEELISCHPQELIMKAVERNHPAAA